LRAQLTPSGRGKRPATDVASAGANIDDRSPIERRRAMTPDQVRGRLWAQRLKRVFGIDVKTCIHCGGSVRIVASIENPKPSGPYPQGVIHASTTSQNTARWSQRTTGRQRAHRPRGPRNRRISHNAEAKTATPSDAATSPQGCARPAVGNRREIATNGAAEPPSTRRSALR